MSHISMHGIDIYHIYIDICLIPYISVDKYTDRRVIYQFFKKIYSFYFMITEYLLMFSKSFYQFPLKYHSL